MEVLYLVLSQLASGGTLFIAVLPAEPRFARYYATSAAIYLGLGLCAAAAALAGPGFRGTPTWLEPAALGILLAGLAAAFFLALQGLLRPVRPIVVAAGAFGLAAVVSDSMTYVPAALAGRDSLPLGFLAGALLLGSTFGSLILAHFYLVFEGVSLRPVTALAAVFALAIFLRAASIVPGLTPYWSRGGEIDLASSVVIFDLLFGNDALFFWVRVGLGLALPLILAALTFGTLRVRSTTSATGILYAACVLVLVGELTSRYLLVLRKLPV